MKRRGVQDVLRLTVDLCLQGHIQLCLLTTFDPVSGIAVASRSRSRVYSSLALLARAHEHCGPVESAHP